MTVGSPDHVRLSDDAHSRYTWKWNIKGPTNLPDGVTVTLFDIDFEGVLAAITCWTDYKSTVYQIFVDGVLIMDFWPEWIFEYWMLRNPGCGMDIVGISRYDEVNDIYNLWWQSHFKCYVKNNIKVTAKQDSGAPQTAKITSITYLKR